ncbi:nicastrin-like [Planococcus citri]|uniref:nicastrin-like n=1 Tax=Planococcus citri TaxID=170843 RepID=UPI0031F803B1
MYTLIMYALILISVLASHCTAFQFQSKMYITLDQTSPCVLRMNSTHTFGCTSPRQGNTGVLHVVNNPTDLQWVLNSSPMDSYIVVINIDMFTREYLQKMNSTSKVTGILLAQNQPRPEIKPTSPEDTCPNRYSALARRETTCEKPWNPIGTGILQERWNIPIFFTKDNDTITQLHDCFHRNAPYDESQTSRSLCALQLSSHMYGAVDSRTCLRRNAGTFNINPIKYCDEMGSENIYLPIIPLAKFKPARKSYVVVAARLDAASFFYQNNPASLSVATSLTTLVLTAKLLYDMTKGEDFSKYDQNVVFILFNGEAYDYIGSSRVVYDLQKKLYPNSEHPISMDEIDLYIELSQLYNTSTLYNHNRANANVSSFISKFQQRLINATLTPSTRSTLPPSSMQNFLLAKSDFPGVILSSYDDHFSNNYYHGLFDDDYNINYKYAGKNETAPEDSIQSFVANFATSLAATLYEQISKSTPNASATVTNQEADELLHCYVDTLSCDLVKETGINSFLPEDVISTKAKGIDYYVGVITGQTQWIVLTTKLFLIYFSGYKTNSTNFEECANQNTFWIPSKNICLKSELNITDAISPAFVIKDYNMTSGEYATWTESIWTVVKVRMFMQPSRGYEWLVFVAGVLIFCGSFAFTYSVKKNAKELFDYPNLITASNI